LSVQRRSVVPIDEKTFTPGYMRSPVVIIRARVIGPCMDRIWVVKFLFVETTARTRPSHKWTTGMLALGQEIETRPPRLSWRDSLLRYFGFDPLLDRDGQEMHWVRRVSAVANELS